MARGRKPSPGGLADQTGAGGGPAVEPPDDLSPAALAVWRRVVPLIAEAVALRPADSDALRAYCEAAALRARALRELDAPGVELVLVTPNGAQQINPLITIADKAAAVMMKHAERFGLDPASRKRLQIAQKKTASPFADFLNRKPKR